jgi:CRP-like cAMP-binding protein
MLKMFEKRLRGLSSIAVRDLKGLGAIASRPRIVRRKSDAYLEGVATPGTHVLADGLLCRYKTGLDGERRIVSFIIPGDLFGFESLFDMESDYGVGALADSIIVQLPHERLRPLLRSSFDLHTAFWQIFAAELRISREWVVRLGASAHVRVAHLICELATRFGMIGLPRDAPIPWNVSQVDLSEALAITSVHVNRVLQDMRRGALIELKSQTLRILDWPRLAAMANFDAIYLGAPETAAVVDGNQQAPGQRASGL